MSSQNSRKPEDKGQKPDGTTDYIRPTWDEYFIEVMEAVSKRVTSERGRSGCVIVKDQHIVAKDSVGSAQADDHSDDVGHLFQKRLNSDGTTSNHCVRTIHAEQNAICQAAKKGASIDGGTLYCRMTPCAVCAKMIISCGIKRVVAQRKYHDGKHSEDLFLKCGVKLEYVFDEVQEYSKQKGFK